MLDLKFIRENQDTVIKGVKAKGVELNLKELLALDAERRDLLQTVEELKHKRNTANERISLLKRKGEDPKEEIEGMKTMSHKIKDLDGLVGEVDSKIQVLLLNIPNLPHNSVPVGPGPKFNKVVRTCQEPPKFSFEPKSHIEIGESLSILSGAWASKISGSGFMVFRGDGAKLERALINFMIDLHTKKHGYTEISPPYLVNRESMTGTGQLPKLEEDMYRLKDEDFFLIPTAEVPVTNLHREDTLEGSQLPVKYVAYTACFRREAGSYGKDTKGLFRVHQFDKVELVKFTTPESSYDELENLVKDAEDVLQLLGLPYRVVLLSSGDLSFAAAKCYDLEVWAPGSKRWLEVSSCSNFSDFQARRMNIKYRPASGGKPQYVHTLNGSGVALARTVAALLENYQRADGTITYPEVLKPYLS